MREQSPYEGTQDKLNGFAALGRVISVDNTARRCRVKTIGKPGLTDDMDLYNVQWISLSNSGQGADDAALPTPNQYGIILFINSEPYIVGWFQPIASEDDDTISNVRPDKEPLLPGDRVIKTIAGNKIILRSGGSVEISSTAICRVYLLPSRNLVNVVCQNLEIQTDGGYQNWDRDPATNDTLLERLAWDNLEPVNAVHTQEGSTDAGTTYRKSVGPLDENSEVSVPTFDDQIAATGTQLRTLAQALYHQVGPTGAAYATSVDSKNLQTSFTTPSGHAVVFDDTTADGSISVIHKTGASIQITGTGNLNFQTADGNTISFGSGTMGFISKQGGIVQVTDQVTISDASGAQLMTVTKSGINITAKSINLQAPSIVAQASTLALGNSTTELLATIYNLFTALGTVQVLTAVGPSAPFTASPEWASLLILLVNLQLLTGTIT